MRRKFVALDDPELNSWLLELVADPPPSFLSAIAEAVLTANLEDYAVVRCQKARRDRMIEDK
jgi:hypothetical protein